MTGTSVIVEDKPTTPSVKIDSANNGIACIGETVKYVATPTDGGSAPTYVWKSNGVVVIGTGDTYREHTCNRRCYLCRNDQQCILHHY